MIYIVEIKRKKGETFEAFLRRFNKKLVESGKLFQARKIQHFTRPLKPNKRRKDAVRRGEIRIKREYLLKTGAIKETTRR